MAITTQVFDKQFQSELRQHFPELNIYEVYGKADLILRLYSTERALRDLKRFLDEKLALIGESAVFEVDDIFRIWGHDVDGRSIIGVESLGSKDLLRIAKDWFDANSVENRDHQVILGLSSFPTGDPQIRAFMLIKQQNPSKAELGRLTEKILECPNLRQTIYGIYQGTPGLGLEGNVFLEVASHNYHTLRPLVEEVYRLALPLTIKTTTYLASHLDEVGDIGIFEDTPDIILQAYLNKFSDLKGDAIWALKKITALDPLKPFWDAPPPLGSWVDKISICLIKEDVDELAGPVAEIARKVERVVKSVLVQWAKQEFGGNWLERSAADLALKEKLPKSSLGQLIYAARKIRVSPLPIEQSVLERFVRVRNSLVHDQESMEHVGQPLLFEQIQAELPAVLALLFWKHQEIFVR